MESPPQVMLQSLLESPHLRLEPLLELLASLEHEVQALLPWARPQHHIAILVIRYRERGSGRLASSLASSRTSSTVESTSNSSHTGAIPARGPGEARLTMDITTGVGVGMVSRHA
jgi:hypothetical protein